MENNKTITAISTGFSGAIAIIRISGKKTLELLNLCFFSKREVEHRFVRTGRIKIDKIQDLATAVYFAGPDSYTGEDMAEISIHANPILAEKLIKFLISSGAELAGRGEFTKRAFLNGKMDLSSAEAVIDIINAESESELRFAVSQSKGSIRKEIDDIQNKLEEILAESEAAIDFPEEDLEQQINPILKTRVKEICSKVDFLLDSYQNGRIIKQGVKVVLIGSVNVGKSSILNALIKKERAIVTDIPGTTRDILEDRFEYNGQKFIISDTAGIRESSDIVEAKGIEIAKNAAKESDIIVIVTQAGQGINDNLKKVIQPLQDKPQIVVENKIDIYNPTIKASIKVSAKTGQNIDFLKQEIYNKTAKTIKFDNTAVITDFRHYQILQNTKQILKEILQDIKDGVSSDLLSSSLLAAYNEVGKITGRSGSEQIIEQIFSRFCVGK